MTKKKKLVTVWGSLGIAAVLGFSALAYFAAKDNEPNLVGVGEDSITITESFTPPDQTQPYKKVVKITNTGSVPCYVRARIEFSDSEMLKKAEFSYADPDSAVAPAESTFHPADPEAESSYVQHLPEKWIYNAADGYYYYTDKVGASEATSTLLAWVKMNHETDEKAEAHDIYVYSESVQTIDPKTGEAYTGYQDAWTKFTAETT